MSAEILKGCQHCGSLPKLSSISDYKTTHAYVCCRIGMKGQSEEEAAHYWNVSNINCAKTYRKNNKTSQWELLDENSTAT